jgi:hypothetical protein
LAVLTACISLLAGACGPREPRTDAERLARGREIIERMSAKLGSAQSLSVSTTEAREEAKANGDPQAITLNRETVIRRPDRMYSKVSGSRETEIWYDGVGITVVMHNDKVFGQARSPETLDKTLDAVHDRYGVAAPLGDFLYTSPAKALLADTTTGGWVGRETVDGQETDHLSFKDKGVDWELWISTQGDPLPVKGAAVFPDSRRLRKVSLTFKNWNLAPQVAADRFEPHVPADYEGIAIIQRARVLRNLPPGEEEPAPAAAGK